MIKNRLPNFVYEESEVLDALLNVIQEEFDRFRSYVEERVLSWYLETSSGEDLDRIGLLVGEPRRGRDDEEYRTAILSKVTSIVGTKDVILNTAQLLSSDRTTLEESPGRVDVVVYAEDMKVGTVDLLNAVRRVKAAGIYAFLDMKTELVDEPDVTEQLERVAPWSFVDELDIADEAVVKDPLRPVDEPELSENIQATFDIAEANPGLEDTVLLAESVDSVLKTAHYWDVDSWDLMAWN